MKYVAEKNNLNFETDVKSLNVGDVDDFYDYFKSNPNRTLYAVLFCTKEY